MTANKANYRQQKRRFALLLLPVICGVMAQVKVCCRLIPYVSACRGPLVAIEWTDLQNKLRMKNFTNRGL